MTPVRTGIAPSGEVPQRHKALSLEEVELVDEEGSPFLRWLFESPSVSRRHELVPIVTTPELPVKRKIDFSGMEAHHQGQAGPSSRYGTPPPPPDEESPEGSHPGSGVRASLTSAPLQPREQLKAELLKLLEEIFENHPEALELLGNIRKTMTQTAAQNRRPDPSGSQIPSGSSHTDNAQGSNTQETGTASANAPKSSRSSRRSRTSRSSHGSSSRDRRRPEALRGRSTDLPLSSLSTNPGSGSGPRRGVGGDGGEWSLAPYAYQALVELMEKPQTHVAQSHEDTTTGAVHFFVDEEGIWRAYSFDADGGGVSQTLGNSNAVLEMLRAQAEIEAMNAGPPLKGASDGAGGGDEEPRSSEESSQSEGAEPYLLSGGPSVVLYPGASSGIRDHPSYSIPVAGSIPRRRRFHSGDSDDEQRGLTISVPRHIIRPSTANSDQWSALELRLANLGGGGDRRLRTSRGRPGQRRTTLTGSRSGGRGRGSSSHHRFRMDSAPSLRNPITLMVERTLAAAHNAAAGAGTTGAQTGPSGSGSVTAGSSAIRLSSDPGVFPLPPPISWQSSTGSSSIAGGAAGNAGGSATSATQAFNRIRLLNALSGSHGAKAKESSRKRVYYRIPISIGKLGAVKELKLKLDRLELLALFDRNRSKLSLALDVFLAILVCFLAGLMLKSQFYHDISVFVFCAVAGAAQFSLLKSVQPDAASPVHGYNPFVTYSRASYFCLTAVGVLLLDLVLTQFDLVPLGSAPIFELYKIPLVSHGVLKGLQSFLIGLFLAYPLIFTIGLLPQINTFAMHVAEQIEVLFLGGTAAVSLKSSLYTLSRSLAAVGLCVTLGHLSIRYAPARPGETATGPGNGNRFDPQNVMFSVFCAVLTVLAYLLSRGTSNIGMLYRVSTRHLPWLSFGFKKRSGPPPAESDALDPLPEQLKEVLLSRFKADLLSSVVIGVLVFAVHTSTVFTLQPYLTFIIGGLATCLGFLLHYVLPQLRRHAPWKLLAKPILRPLGYTSFEVSTRPAALMGFERLYIWACFVEKNIVYPVFTISCIMSSAEELCLKFGSWCTPLILAICGLKILRTAYATPAQLYMPLLAALLLFNVDFGRTLADLGAMETVLINFYVLVVLFPKFCEFKLKLEFIFVYVTPWQISWGSAFHAFAQPFSVPHSAFAIVQAFMSSIISAPLNPFLGSSLFIASYPRPIKFWEKDYNTERVDNSNIRLVNQFDRGPTTDDNNLNSIFYEHLTRCLQSSLAGDFLLGRWSAEISQGSCFILASYYLNCLVHIIEVGNGFVTFQLRGLEFRGTYCQQREVEAITEEFTLDNDACCCFEPGHIPGFLSLNTAWNLRWLAWEVTTGRYIVEGYSITDNSAAAMLQVYELRKLLVTQYVNCIIFYTVSSQKILEWLSDEGIKGAFEEIGVNGAKYVDVDPVFTPQIDEDYDHRLSGISKNFFALTYLAWIRHCCGQSENFGVSGCGDGENGASDGMEIEANSPIVTLCYALSLVGRRALAVASHNRHSSVESFLYGLHALFKGDFRIMCARDEWVFSDMDFLHCVIAPAVRMALKLHQDHFASPDDYNDTAVLYEAIREYQRSMFISHESDPAWRAAVLSNMPSLLALRHATDDGTDEYKILMLNKRYLNFRVIQLNKECVRGLWSGQQQELIFLRNRNPERGSIQNARQALRNMINSSADQPIGYPIYVSPLTTSFCERHWQIEKVLGPPITFGTLVNFGKRIFRRLRAHCGMNCSSNVSLYPQCPRNQSSTLSGPPGTAILPPNVPRGSTIQSLRDSPQGTMEVIPMSAVASSSSLSMSRTATKSEGSPRLSDALTPQRRALMCKVLESRANPGSPRASVVSSSGRTGGSPRVSLTTDKGLPDSVAPPKIDSERVKILDTNEIFTALDQVKGHGSTLVVWPNEKWRARGGRAGKEGPGSVIHILKDRGAKLRLLHVVL